MPFCPNCGKEVQAGMNFCPSCGYSVATFFHPVSSVPSTRFNTSAVGDEPLSEKEDYWVFASPPESARPVPLTKVDATKFLKEVGGPYAVSGLMFSRDIFFEPLVAPSTDVENALYDLDLQAINMACNRKHTSYLVGKWLVFVPALKVNQVWQTVSSAIDKGNLPYPAKVATARENPNATDQGTKVMCVYTSNYLDRPDVRNCRKLLRDLGFAARLYYKPDIFTYRDMYRKTGSKVNSRYFG